MAVPVRRIGPGGPDEGGRPLPCGGEAPGQPRRGAAPGVRGRPQAGAAAEAGTPENAVARVQALRAEGLAKKDAVKQAAKETGTARNALYDLVLQTL